MRHILLNKYLAGETTAKEEQELRRLLLSMSQSKLTEDERIVLDLLSYIADSEEEEDIFAVDYTEEYDKVVRPRHTIRLWPYVAAACIAGAMFIFLTPPKKESHQQTGEQQVAHIQSDTTSTELLAEDWPVVKEEEKDIEPISVVQPKANRQLIAESDLPTSTVEEKKERNEEQDMSRQVNTQRDVDVQLATLETTEEDPSASYTITHPERLEYTPEEIEVLKQRAREKYMEWIQLEREILEADRRRTASME